MRRGDEKWSTTRRLAQRGPTVPCRRDAGAVGVSAGALGVAGRVLADDHVLPSGMRVLHAHRQSKGHGAALVAVLLGDLGQLVGDDTPLALREAMISRKS